MTEKDMLPVASHYYEMGRYQEAYNALTAMALDINRADQIEHHSLLAGILEGLGRDTDALVLTDELLGKFPDDERCIMLWIEHGCNDCNRAQKAYEMAQSMLKTDPEESWYPMIMAQIAFHYRLQPKAIIIEQIEQALALDRNDGTLAPACRIYGAFNRSKEHKACLDELIQLAPDSETTYILLLEFLEKNRRYTELGQVGYEAIRKFPGNKMFEDFLDIAIEQLYGGYLGRIYSLAVGVGRRLILQRSSHRAWFRILGKASVYLSIGISWLIVIAAVMLYGLGALFFFHYFVITSDERNIRKQRKRRSQKQEFGYDDKVIDLNGVASTLVSSTHLRHRFIYISAHGIVLAKDVWCPVENLHFDFDTEHLKDACTIAHHQIKRIELSSKYLIIKTTGAANYKMYFESIESLDFIMEQLSRFNYRITKTKRSSRLLLAVFCFWGTKSGLWSVFFLSFVYWKFSIFLCVVVLTNFISLFLYRFIFPLRTEFYRLQTIE
jgi:tetratricopeptide (TPR) repeat protein